MIGILKLGEVPGILSGLFLWKERINNEKT